MRLYRAGGSGMTLWFIAPSVAVVKAMAKKLGLFRNPARFRCVDQTEFYLSEKYFASVNKLFAKNYQSSLQKLLAGNEIGTAHIVLGVNWVVNRIKP